MARSVFSPTPLSLPSPSLYLSPPLPLSLYLSPPLPLSRYLPSPLQLNLPPSRPPPSLSTPIPFRSISPKCPVHYPPSSISLSSLSIPRSISSLSSPRVPSLPFPSFSRPSPLPLVTPALSPLSLPSPSLPSLSISLSLHGDQAANVAGEAKICQPSP